MNALDQVLDAFTTSWAAWTKRPWPLVLGTVLVFAMQMVVQCTARTPGMVPGEVAQGLDPAVLLGILGAALVAAGLAIVLGFVEFFVACYLGVGMVRAAAAALDDQERPGVLWSGADKALAVAGWRFVAAFLNTVVLLACLVPGIGLVVAAVLAESWGLGAAAALVCLGGLLPALWVQLGLQFGECFIVLENEPVFDALARSWELAAGKRLAIFALVLLSGCVVGLGLLACLVGAIPASAYIHVVKVDTFRRLRSFAPESP